MLEQHDVVLDVSELVLQHDDSAVDVLQQESAEFDSAELLQQLETSSFPTLLEQQDDPLSSVVLEEQHDAEGSDSSDSLLQQSVFSSN
ncbi:hypothetical protein M3602_05865 [Terribacillus saccharophilus]|nr:hypothetical protein [Terribacillus saccharophilus]